MKGKLIALEAGVILSYNVTIIIIFHYYGIITFQTNKTGCYGI